MFHVPERARVVGHQSFGNNGAFEVPSCAPGWMLFLICTDGEGWEHVSVHARNRAGRKRTPGWDEMRLAKDLCWDDDDLVMQLHPRRSQYVNVHPNVLHLWRPIGREIPEPDRDLVG